MVLIRAFREREEAGDLIGVALRYVEEEMEMAEGRLEWVNEEEMKMPVSAPKWMVEEIEYQKETAQRKLRASQAVARWMQWKIASKTARGRKKQKKALRSKEVAWLITRVTNKVVLTAENGEICAARDYRACLTLLGRHDISAQEVNFITQQTKHAYARYCYSPILTRWAKLQALSIQKRAQG